MIRVRNIEFSDARECAEHFGVTTGHVHLYRRKGKLDRIGTGIKGKKSGRYPDPENRMPVTVRGDTFLNAHAAAEHFGRSVSTVYNLLAAGRIDSLAGPKGPPKGTPNPHRSLPVTIGPHHYPSRSAAARALGIHKDYVSRALRGVPGYRLEHLIRRAMELSASEQAAEAARRAEQDRRRLAV